MINSIDAEKETIDLKARYKGIFDATNNGLAVFSATEDGTDFIFLDLNTAFEKTERIDRKSVIGKSITEIFPSVKNIGFFNVLQRVWKTGQPVDLPVHKYNDGRISGWRKNYVYKLPTGEIVSWSRDETQQKTKELALRQSYEKLELEFGARNKALKSTKDESAQEIQACERFEAQPGKTNLEWRAAFDAVNSALSLLDKDGNLLKANKAMTDMMQKPFIEIHGKPCWEIVHGKDRPIEDCPFIQMKKTLKRETVTRRVDQRWLEFTVDPVLDNQGKLEGAVQMISDITARTNTEKSLENNTKNLQTVLDSIHTGVLIIDKDSHKIIEVNHHAAQLIGLPKKDILSQKCHNFVCQASEGQCPISDLGQSGGHADKNIVTPDGKQIPIIKSAVIGKYLGKTALIESFVDITELKEAVEGSREADRLSGIFEMADAVSHEPNQLLMAISGYLELLSMEISGYPSITKSIDKAYSKIKRISEITANLMAINGYESKNSLRNQIGDTQKVSSMG